MHVRWLLVLPLAALAIAAAVYLRPGAPGEAVEPVEPPLPEASAPESEAEELELDGDVIHSRELSLGSASDAGVEPQIEAGSPPVQLHGTLIDLNTRLPLPEFDLEFEVAGGGDELLHHAWPAPMRRGASSARRR